MTTHGEVDANRVLLLLAVLTLLVSLSLFGIGIASLAGVAGYLAFVFASILLGIAWSLQWLRGRLAAQAARRQPR